MLGPVTRGSHAREFRGWGGLCAQFQHQIHILAPLLPVTQLGYNLVSRVFLIELGGFCP